jgi:hypothetical protein
MCRVRQPDSVSCRHLARSRCEVGSIFTSIPEDSNAAVCGVAPPARTSPALPRHSQACRLSNPPGNLGEVTNITMRFNGSPT